jgi:hypothetical protein
MTVVTGLSGSKAHIKQQKYQPGHVTVELQLRTLTEGSNREFQPEDPVEGSGRTPQLRLKRVMLST